MSLRTDRLPVSMVNLALDDALWLAWVQVAVLAVVWGVSNSVVVRRG